MRTEPDLELDRRHELGVALARFTWRRLFVRLFAVVTCLVALVGIWATYIAYDRVNRAEGAAQRQLTEISDSFTKVADSLGHVGGSANQAADTAGQAKTALGSAATTTRSAADTLDQTASAIDITILGSRPLAGVGVTFQDQARQLRSLADQIDRTGSSVGDNSGYLRAIGADAAVMANDVTRVSQQLRQFAGYGPGPSSLLQITASTRLILTWSVVVHLVLFGVGISLWLLTVESRR